MGETAPRGNGNVVHPLRFLRGALCLNSRYWGHVRPHDGRERVVIEYRRHGGAWRRLKARTTGGRGYFATSTRYRRGRSYRLRWRSYAGSPTRPIRWG